MSQSQTYYDILGISKTATDKEIKKAYKRLAMRYHPDKADDDKKEEHTKKFQQITEANEILSDPEKRKIYDIYGKEGLDESRQRQSHPGGAGMPDIFNMFPGMFNVHTSRPRGPRKSKDTQFNLGISLSQAYTGVTKKIRVTKDTVVDTHIDPPEQLHHNFERSWNTCSMCSGQGTVVEQTRMGNMVQMTQKRCGVCNGAGSCMKPGYEIRQQPENVSIEVPKGVRHGTQIRLSNKGNCSPGTLPGDIVVILQIPGAEKGFTRRNNDLRYTHTILLSEALCGGKLKIVTLDDRNLFIKFGPISPGDIKIIKGEGMKIENGTPGDLYIDFEIKFPKLSKEQQATIKKTLPIAPDAFEDNKIKYVL